MKTCFYISLLLFSMLFVNVCAQDAAFVEAKKKLDQQRYRESKDAFEVIIRSASDKDYIEYAYYFGALAAYKSGDNFQAKEWLLTLTQEYAEWQQREEAFYLLGLLQMDDGQPEQGLQTFRRITQPAIKEDAHAIKKHFLKEQPLSRLRTLYVAFAQDKALGETLADRLFSEPTLSEADSKLLTDLKFKFVYTPEKTSASQASDNQNLGQTLKKSYTVGFFMPFQLSELNPSAPQRKNQFVYDLYEGMKIGAEQLLGENITINFVAFDTEKNVSTINRILADPELRHLDLIVGPAYSSETQPILAFARAHRIPIVNPFSKNSELLNHTELQYLTSPSYHTQGVQVSNYLINTLNKNKAYILYGSSKGDSALAASYKKNVELKGGTVAVFKKLGGGSRSYSDVQVALQELKPDPKKTLQAEKYTDENMGLSPVSDPNVHLAVFTDDPAVALSVISALQTKQLNLPLVITDEWLLMEQMNIAQIDSRDTYIISANYVDEDKQLVRDFNKIYSERTNIFPSIFAHLGYETMLYFGRALNKNGKNFINKLRSLPAESGALLHKLDYSTGNDNQYVPILKFVNGKLTLINP
ncbi:MAG: hypothetical protein EAZ57_01220 [Cytophagales bacterium]|nr:MAG: hypothetical protein EAZ67_02055 [Cytophagales bacterium]TAF62070.1 MAG: hypothetical protein EAZ57_01220 [Cytophagales bacterium]